MSEPYEETILGETTLRLPPGPRHELICARLHAALKASVANLTSTRLLEVREPVTLSHDTKLCPDIALVTTAANKLWLAVEVVSSEDHHVDTVAKKEFYETMKLPRLWMVDPRYNNVELYHASEYGMRLEGILAQRDVLTEKLLPEFQLAIADLFAITAPNS
jgi:Uma2 family endonuclease